MQINMMHPVMPLLAEATTGPATTCHLCRLCHTLLILLYTLPYLNPQRVMPTFTRFSILPTPPLPLTQLLIVTCEQNQDPLPEPGGDRGRS